MPSLFHGVYQALYDYEARTEDELTFSENSLLYLLEKSSTDEWLKAKKLDLRAPTKSDWFP